MLTKIKAHDLIVRIDSQTDDCIDDLQDNIGSDSRQDPGNQNACGLIQELMGIPSSNPTGSARPWGSLKIALTPLTAKIPVSRAPNVPPAP